MTSHATLESSGAAEVEHRARMFGMLAAACAALGVLTSGPGAMLIVARIHPQPPWTSPEVFARFYHPIQIVPFAFGFLLVSGFLGVITSIHLLAGPHARVTSLIAWSAALLFAALVFFNYIVQSTFIPALVHPYRPANGALIAAFSMGNPASLGWALEMWGYAFLGVATWLSAPFFGGAGAERLARWTFIANGPLSLLAAFWTALQPGWEFSTLGFTAFAAWNVLAFVMACAACVAFRQRLRGYRRNKKRTLRSGREEAAHLPA